MKILPFNKIIVFLIIMALGGTVIFYINRAIQNYELEQRITNRTIVHKKIASLLQSSIDNFVILMASTKSFIDFAEAKPRLEDLQSFINSQLENINSSENLVVSYIDTAHVFQYSFSRDAIDPAGLTGKSVYDLREKEEITRLDNVLRNDGIFLFNPINLKEGWIGIPINFRVKIDDKTVGYIAALLDLSEVMATIYDATISDEYVLRFMTDGGHDFDRYAVYDESPIYNNSLDNEFYENYVVDTTLFEYETIALYNSEITVGIAFKKQSEKSIAITILLYSWLAMLLGFTFYVLRQAYFYQRLNKSYATMNKTLIEQKVQIINQNEQLVEADVTKNKFFSIIGHDLRAPLNSVTGLISLLKFERIQDKALANLVSRLELATKNTMDFLENLLRWASIQTGDLKLNKKKHDLKVTVSDTINVLQPALEQKDISIQIRIDDRIELHYDNEMISAVIRNLISNAIKFTNVGGKIEVSADLNQNEYIIQVKDNGSGMKQKIKDNLFKIGKNLSLEGTQGELGSGIGLILCHEFILKHGGRIWVESKLDIGSCFFFSLPRQTQ